MRILITGANGFVGSNLVEHLKRNSSNILYGIDIKGESWLSYDKFYTWAEMDRIPWDRLEVVIHLAGKAHDTKNVVNEYEYYEVNVELTKLIFDQFQISSAKKFIFFSSVKAAADKVVGVLEEDVIAKPATVYGRTKLEAEKYILGQVSSAEKKVIVFRPAMIHGPGNKGNLNLLFKYVQTGLPYPFGNNENKRSFTSIDNMNYLIQKVIESNSIKSGIYNIADDETLSTASIFRCMSQSLEKSGLVLNTPALVIKLIGKISDYLHLPMTTERINKLTETYVVSNKKIKKELGIENLPVSAIIGMEKTLASYKGR